MALTPSGRGGGRTRRWAAGPGPTASQPDEYSEPKVSGLLRVREYTGPSLETLDREHPLPAPPPKVEQVWVWPDTASMVVHVVQHADGPIAVFPDAIPSGSLSSSRLFPEDWPPAGAVLVAGVGAPWAPMGEP